MRSRRRFAAVVALAIVAAVFAVGLAQSDGPLPSSGLRAPSVAQARAQIQGAPEPLRRLYARSNALLPETTFDDLLTGVRGRPVVINVWASYCGPCREEFGLLRRAAARYGERVAFVGLNADATRGPAEAFLRKNPTLYPHVQDPEGTLAGRLSAGVVLPSTVILHPDGQIATVFAGAYPTAQRLAEDLARYAKVTSKQ